MSGAEPAASPVRVSVIVPVYNAGAHIESCVRSILDQSLGREAVEGILVDDGSTDDTPARLDALAAEHRNIRVVHQENSGWPGKPRNVGIDMARGEYLFFLDNDDRLGLEALERMCAMASRNASDIVLGKMAGFHRAVPKHLFFETRERTSLAEAPLIEALTPHKLFRRAFVEDLGLRFPEGRRRLEDHVFVVRAYFAATSISVLSDYVCYYHIRRDDHSNAGLRRLDPAGYYGNLREVLGIVEANTEPGPFRDRLLERFARAELLGRLRDRGFVEHADDYRRQLFDTIRGVVQDHIPPSVDLRLAPAHRVQMELLRAGRLDLMTELAAADLLVAAQARLDGVTQRGESFAIRFEAGLAHDGAPLVLDRRGGATLLPVPDSVAAVVSDEARTIPERSVARPRLVLRKRDDWAELFPPTAARPTADSPASNGDAVIASEATLDPATVSLGSPIWPGTWDVLVRVEAYGYSRDKPLGAVRSADVPAVLPRVDLQTGAKRRRIAPYWTKKVDNLAFKVTDAPVRPLHSRALSALRRRLRAAGLPL
jgi:glycosyltransferase involved in cell wall biosynthesis